jgi:hypothetical protein
MKLSGIGEKRIRADSPLSAQHSRCLSCRETRNLLQSRRLSGLYPRRSGTGYRLSCVNSSTWVVEISVVSSVEKLGGVRRVRLGKKPRRDSCGSPIRPGLILLPNRDKKRALLSGLVMVLIDALFLRPLHRESRSGLWREALVADLSYCEQSVRVPCTAALCPPLCLPEPQNRNQPLGLYM